MVDVGRPDQSMHRRIDRRCGAAFAVKAEVERGHHVVLVVGAGVNADQRPEPVQPEHGQARFGQVCRGRHPSP